METTCGSILYELQVIWDEVGETQEERDRQLLDVEQECMEVYRRKLNQANRLKVELRRSIADLEAELASICSALGEPPVHLRKGNQSPKGLKEELAAIGPQLDVLRMKKTERWMQLQDVMEQIQKIRNEIGEDTSTSPQISIDDSDLSTRRLEEFQMELEMLQKKKAQCLQQVIEHLSTINSHCLVLGMDFKVVVGEIHPSLADSGGVRDFSSSTIEMLSSATRELQAIKRERIHRLQDFVTSMLELWHLMDTPAEEQEQFQNVTCNIAASEDEITDKNSLSEDFINQIKTEVLRLEQLKTSKIKELIMGKRSELEELRRQTHIIVQSDDDDMEYPVEAIDSGIIDASLILEQLEVQIANAKEEAFSRKDILEKVEKWMAVCEEESWLEEYNKDENRYSAGKGSHLVLKRAEKARTTISKIPAMVDNLITKTTAWENEKGIIFAYDGVSLLSMLEDYTILRQEKEQDRRRQRDQRRLQGQLIAEQEVLYGSKLGSKTQSAKKTQKVSSGRRLSMGGTMLQPVRHELMQSPRTTPRSARKADDDGEKMAGVGRGLHTRHLSFNSPHTSDIDVQPPRRPFTPIVPIPSMDDDALHTDDENGGPTAVIRTPASDPKTAAVKTLKAPIAIPPSEDPTQECVIEYSFEERRAGYRLPPEQSKC